MHSHNTGYQDALGNHCVLEQHKKTQAEMKVALSEIKKNLQGTNSEVGEAKNQINDLKHSNMFHYFTMFKHFL